LNAPRAVCGGIFPLETAKQTGFISVSAEPGVAIKPVNFEGLTEIPAAMAAAREGTAGGSVLAFKYIASSAQPAAAWKLSFATEAVESWLRAEIVNTLTVADSLVSGRALARFEIQNAPVKELRLRIPASFDNVEISGPNIRRRDHEADLWRVQFQNKIIGPHVLTVTWDQARSARTNRVDLRGISAEGVERETGVLALVAHPPLQLTEQHALDLISIDTRNLPDRAGSPDEATVLAYRYLRPGYALTVEAKRFASVEALQALVEQMNLTTVVADDGQTMTALALSVRNHGRQYLEIALPAGASAWSAFVAGEALRPSVREGKLLVPLERATGDDAPLAIELTYAGTNRFPQTQGTVVLDSPRLDAPLKSARWEQFLPPDYRYSKFGGTMARELGGPASEASNFSRFDYKQQEFQNMTEQNNELKSELTSAKEKLSSGKVKEAWADYKRARAKGGGKAKDAETQKLEDDLNRAQGSNLISAQNSFSRDNLQNKLKNSADVPQAAEREQGIAYDEAAAQAQWTKLEQAQQVGVAKVQPIHVNLPTRGLRHAFTQVLQTQTGKALTIRLFAVNANAVSWPGRIATGLGMFLALWMAMAATLRRAQRSAHTE
jgi:hypothetical protein